MIGLEKVESVFDGFNHKRMTLEDLVQLCMRICEIDNEILLSRRPKLYNERSSLCKTLICYFGDLLGFYYLDIDDRLGGLRGSKYKYFIGRVSKYKNKGKLNEKLAFLAIADFLDIEESEIIGTSGELVDFFEKKLTQEEWDALCVIHRMRNKYKIAIQFLWDKSIDVKSADYSQIIDESVFLSKESKNIK